MHFCYAFPFCLTIFAHLHIIFNALEEAFKSHELWDRFEPLLKAVISLLGDQPKRQRFIAVCMASAAPWQKRMFHTFPKHTLDWKWQVLETVTEALCQLWDVFCLYYDPDAMTKNGDLSTATAPRKVPRKVPMISKTPERQRKKSTKKVVLKHGCFVLD